MSLGCGVFALPAAQFFQTDSQRDGALATNGVARHVEEFSHQADSILDRAPIGIGAAVVFGQ
ncbi:MAG: hypothetical protein NVS9B2_19750 [Steroidobacteraceae bacterium]